MAREAAASVADALDGAGGSPSTAVGTGAVETSEVPVWAASEAGKRREVARARSFIDDVAERCGKRCDRHYWTTVSDSATRETVWKKLLPQFVS